MESFKDSNGVERALTLTVGKARRFAKCKALDIDFIDGDPAKIGSDLMLRRILQIDLIWEMLDGKEGLEQEAFEDSLEGSAFEDARLALFAEIENFIQSIRPNDYQVIQEAILLTTTEITRSAESAVSLFQSTEVKEGFLQANADAESKLKKVISKEFSKLQELSD